MVGGGAERCRRAGADCGCALGMRQVTEAVTTKSAPTSLQRLVEATTSESRHPALPPAMPPRLGSSSSSSSPPSLRFWHRAEGRPRDRAHTHTHTKVNEEDVRPRDEGGVGWGCQRTSLQLTERWPGEGGRAGHTQAHTSSPPSPALPLTTQSCSYVYYSDAHEHARHRLR